MYCMGHWRCHRQQGSYRVRAFEIADVATRRPNPIYMQIRHALKAAEKRGLKVIRSAGGYYKLAPLDDLNPALRANDKRPEQVEKLQSEVDFLYKGLDMYHKDKASYKKIYYRKYGLPKAIAAKIAQLKLEIKDLPYAVEIDSQQLFRGSEL